LREKAHLGIDSRCADNLLKCRARFASVYGQWCESLFFAALWLWGWKISDSDCGSEKNLDCSSGSTI